jgi:hypothetical protein
MMNLTNIGFATDPLRVIAPETLIKDSGVSSSMLNDCVAFEPGPQFKMACPLKFVPFCQGYKPFHFVVTL